MYDKCYVIIDDMRPKRKKLKFDENSVNELLQEIYNDSHTIKAQITRLFTKWEAKVKETGEVAAIGDQIVKLIAAHAKNQDQKIMLLKYLKEVVYENKHNDKTSNKDGVTPTEEISDERRKALIDLVHNEVDKRRKK